jgi:hypothetical protein
MKRGGNNGNERPGKRRAVAGGYVNVHAARRERANIPARRNWPLNLKDPISLNNLSNWNGNRAIEVNHPTNPAGTKIYFKLSEFRTLFGNDWKYMPPNSNLPIHPTVTNPVSRQPIKRKNIRLVYFHGPKPAVVV